MDTLKLLLKITGWIMLGLAVLSFTLTYAIYRHTERFVQTAARAQGTITKIDEQASHHSDFDSDSSTSFFPEYKFQDARGNEHNIHSSTGTNPPKYEVGEKIVVLYQPDNPTDAEIDNFWEVWVWPLVAGILSTIPLVFGAVMFLALLIIRIIERGKAKRPVPGAV